MSNKQVTSLGDRVNFAPSTLDEANILEIQNTLEMGTSEALRSAIHLFADAVRLGMIEQIQREISEKKTIRLIDLERENRELRG